MGKGFTRTGFRGRDVTTKTEISEKGNVFGFQNRQRGSWSEE